MPAVTTMKLLDEIDKHIKDFKVCEECEMRNIDTDNLITGAILGKVILVDTKKYESIKEILKDKKDFSIHFKAEKWFAFPMYGFILKSHVKFDKPLFCKGQLGFWNFNKKVNK